MPISFVRYRLRIFTRNSGTSLVRWCFVLARELYRSLEILKCQSGKRFPSVHRVSPRVSTCDGECDGSVGRSGGLRRERIAAIAARKSAARGGGARLHPAHTL